jgi:23S rRNA (pseudouridine1915-N3)-methyltransferase
MLLVSSFVLQGDESMTRHDINCRRNHVSAITTFLDNRLNNKRIQQTPTTRTPTRNCALYMGMKVNIRIVGRKSSEPWLEDGVEMYETRLKPSNLEIETTWHKDNDALIKGITVDQNKNHKVVCLDPTGKHMTSEQFCDNLYDWLEDGGSRLSFIIGGAEGLPPELKYPAYNGNNKQSPPPLISLSDLTFTHQFARLLLIEQIYRATEIRKVRINMKQK